MKIARGLIKKIQRSNSCEIISRYNNISLKNSKDYESSIKVIEIQRESKSKNHFSKRTLLYYRYIGKRGILNLAASSRKSAEIERRDIECLISIENSKDLGNCFHCKLFGDWTSHTCQILLSNWFYNILNIKIEISRIIISRGE